MPQSTHIYMVAWLTASWRGKVAAALAAGSMLFKSSDPAYSATLLDGA